MYIFYNCDYISCNNFYLIMKALFYIFSLFPKPFFIYLVDLYLFTRIYKFFSSYKVTKINLEIAYPDLKKNDILLISKLSIRESIISGFETLVSSDATNDLADNSQYWLAECYYSQKDFKRAIIEFEKVFTYAGTDKDDDAQLKIGLAYQSIGNVEKAGEEFQRLIDYFPGSEYYPKAKEALKQLSIN